MKPFTFLVMAIALLAKLSAHVTAITDNSPSAASFPGNTNTDGEEIITKKLLLVRNLRHLEGSCNNGCSDDLDCNVYVGGPDPCLHCNHGKCSHHAPPPPPVNGSCGNSCEEYGDCDDFVGGPNPCHFCVNFVCAETQPICDTNRSCTDDNDCDPDHSCVCLMGDYGEGPHCGK
jgi:hypothetical protein